MYAKCGALAKARELFGAYGSRDVLTWTALIAGYAQKGEGQDAISYFEQMQQEGISPDLVTFICILKACGSVGAADKGEKIHEEVAKQGLLENNIVLGNGLVDMYAKCGDLRKAQQVFEKLPHRNVVSWNSLIAGYAQQGESEQALHCYEQMQEDGLSPDVVTFTCVLKACGHIGAGEKGKEIHEEIAKQGLLGKNIVLGSALVDMYAKCGPLFKARQVLESLPNRNVISWTAMIAGYAHKGEDEEALDCFEQMQREGLSPNEVTFVCALKSCGGIRAADKGEKIHYKIAEQGLLGNNIALGNALVDMYAKCGALTKARQVLEGLPVRDVITWSAIIAGYAEQCEGDQALDSFEQMQREGLCPNVVTYISVLKACGSIRAADKGEKIHVEIAKNGLLETHVLLGNALVDVYAKCSALSKAIRVLEELPMRDLSSWNAVVTGFAHEGQGKQVLICYEGMLREGFSPDIVTFTCILKACGSIGAVDTGELVHDEISKQGLLVNNTVLGTAVVDMYVKWGALTRAQRVLEELSVRNVVSWNALIAGYIQEGKYEQAVNCFEGMQRDEISPDAMTFICILKACGGIGAVDKGEEIHDEALKHELLVCNLPLGNALVEMYSKCGAFAKAHRVLEELPIRDVSCWNAIVVGYAQHGEGKRVLECYEEMQREGVSPNIITFSCILKACGSIGAADKGEKVHNEIAKQGLLENNVLIGTAIVDMYAKCGALAKAQHVLQELPNRDVISWSALIAGYAQHGDGEQALLCFEQMQCEGLFPDSGIFTCLLKACGSIGATYKGEQLHNVIASQGMLGSDVVLDTALVDMYARCGALSKAYEVLQVLPIRDVVSWNALMAGLIQQCESAQVLHCFDRMQREDVSPDAITYICVLKACSSIGAADKGEKIHDEISKQGLLGKDTELGNALVDMYAKSGAVAKAHQVLEGLPVRDVISWNTLITGYAQQCKVAKAVECFRRMQSEGVSPDGATLSSILNACSRSSLVEDAQTLLLDVTTKFGLKRDFEHYSCMVDLFGRVGHLDKAIGVIEEMLSSDSRVWSALLGTCQKWADVHVGRWAFEHAIRADEDDAGTYVLMANIYAAAGMHEDADKIEAMRIENIAGKRLRHSYFSD